MHLGGIAAEDSPAAKNGPPAKLYCRRRDGFPAFEVELAKGFEPPTL